MLEVERISDMSGDSIISTWHNQRVFGGFLWSHSGKDVKVVLDCSLSTASSTYFPEQLSWPLNMALHSEYIREQMSKPSLNMELDSQKAEALIEQRAESPIEKLLWDK